MKHNQTLQKILERAKKQFKNNSTGTLENQYVLEKAREEGPVDKSGAKYTFARNSPPAISNAQKGVTKNSKEANERSATKI